MTKNDMDGAQPPQSSSESFLEPRTIPKNWDVSAFESPGTSPSDGSDNPPGEPEPSANAGTYDSDDSEANFDKFPQPRTVPGKWDVSDLI